MKFLYIKKTMKKHHNIYKCQGRVESTTHSHLELTNKSRRQKANFSQLEIAIVFSLSCPKIMYASTSVEITMGEKHNDLTEIIAQTLNEMKKVQGEKFDLAKINLAELERRTGITRASFVD